MGGYIETTVTLVPTGTQYLHVRKMPTSTQVRRQVATTVAGSGTHGELELVSKHLGHLPQTSYK